MRKNKYIIVVSALAVYTVGMGLYYGLKGLTSWSSIFISWAVSVVILVALFFIMRKKEELRKQREVDMDMQDLKKSFGAQNDDLDDDPRAEPMPKEEPRPSAEETKK